MKTIHNQLFIFFAPMIIILSIIFFMNDYMNISGSHSSAEIYQLALKHKENETLVSKDLFDQRQWIKGMLIGQKRCPNILVIGSSTIGAISHIHFPDMSFLNGWLTGPSIEDYEIITQMLHEMNCTPKNIIIGIDPWLFNSILISERWKSLLEYHKKYESKGTTLDDLIQSIDFKWSRFKENLSYVTTKESLSQLIARKSINTDKAFILNSPIKNICSPDILKELVPFSSRDFYSREFDGHFETCSQFILPENKITEIAQTYLKRNTHNMSEWTAVNDNIPPRLNKVIQLLKARKSNVILLSPPYHPFTYESLINNTTIKTNLEKMDTELKKISTSNDIDYMNIRNPSTIGCTSRDFNDSHHSNETCIQHVAGSVSKLLH